MVYRTADVEQLKKDLAAVQALIQLIEDLFNKARPRLGKEEIERSEKFIDELRKKESLLMDAIFRAGESFNIFLKG